MNRSLLIFIFLFSLMACREGTPILAVNSGAKADTILIVTMSFSETDLLKPIEEKISSFYQVKIKRINARLPQSAYIKERDRYKADSLLNYISALNHGRYRFVAGLTSKDISSRRGKGTGLGSFWTG